MNTDWMNTTELSKYLKLSKETTYRLISNRKKNRLPAHRIGKLFRFKKDEIDKWVQKQ